MYNGGTPRRMKRAESWKVVWQAVCRHPRPHSFGHPIHRVLRTKPIAPKVYSVSMPSHLFFHQRILSSVLPPKRILLFVVGCYHSILSKTRTTVVSTWTPTRPRHSSDRIPKEIDMYKIRPSEHVTGWRAQPGLSEHRF
jgi:hypothetical protein